MDNGMRLVTAGDVQNVTFHEHRFARGYDIDEVDDFLDNVAYTLGSLSSPYMESVTQTISSSLTEKVKEFSELKDSNRDLQQQVNTLTSDKEELARQLHVKQEQNTVLAQQVANLQRRIEELSIHEVGEPISPQPSASQSSRGETISHTPQVRSIPQLNTVPKLNTVSTHVDTSHDSADDDDILDIFSL